LHASVLGPFQYTLHTCLPHRCRFQRLAPSHKLRRIHRSNAEMNDTLVRTGGESPGTIAVSETPAPVEDEGDISHIR
jgi:hypothetical protein